LAVFGCEVDGDPLEPSVEATQARTQTVRQVIPLERPHSLG